MKKIFLSLLLILFGFASFAVPYLGEFPGTNACYAYNAQTGKVTLKVNYEWHDYVYHIQFVGPPTSKSWVYIKDPASSSYLGPFSAISYDPASYTAEYDITAIISKVNLSQCIEWFPMTNCYFPSSSLTPPAGATLPPVPFPVTIPSAPHYVPAYNAYWDYPGVTWQACPCPESDPPPTCNSEFILNMHYQSNWDVPPVSLVPFIVSATLHETHAGSTYTYDFGTGAGPTSSNTAIITPNPFYSNTYILCVTETMANGCECTTCVQYTVPTTTSRVYPPGGSGPCTPEGGTINPDLMERPGGENEELPGHKKAVEINPNPTQSSAEISFYVPDKEPVSVKAIDATGKLIYSSKEQIYNAGSQKITLNTNNYVPGLYMIQVKIGKDVITKKLSVTR